MIIIIFLTSLGASRISLIVSYECQMVRGTRGRIVDKGGREEGCVGRVFEGGYWKIKLTRSDAVVNLLLPDDNNGGRDLALANSNSFKCKQDVKKLCTEGQMNSKIEQDKYGVRGEDLQ